MKVATRKSRKFYRTTSDQSGSSGWRQMSDMVHEVDTKKIDDYRDDIDTLLVFAGLFSAVLTALLVESYTMLVPEPGYETPFLLRHLITQNYTVSSGYINSTSMLLSIPPFEAPLWAVRVNTLWFASLVCSLGTASASILVKQWLREYLAIEWTAPQERLRARQYRNAALADWKVLEIAAALPLLLQASHGLFFLGLCIFTAAIDERIGRPTISLVLGWAVFVVATSIGPLISPRCPYKVTVLKSILRSSRHILASPYTQLWRLLIGLCHLAFQLIRTVWNYISYNYELMCKEDNTKITAGILFVTGLTLISLIFLFLSLPFFIIIIGVAGMIAYVIRRTSVILLGRIYPALLRVLMAYPTALIPFQAVYRILLHVFTACSTAVSTILHVFTACYTAVSSVIFHIVAALPWMDEEEEDVVKDTVDNAQLLLAIDGAMVHDGFLWPMWEILQSADLTPHALVSLALTFFKHRAGSSQNTPNDVQDIHYPLDMSLLSQVAWDVLQEIILQSFEAHPTSPEPSSEIVSAFESPWAQAGIFILLSRTRFPSPALPFSMRTLFSDHPQFKRSLQKTALTAARKPTLTYLDNITLAIVANAKSNRSGLIRPSWQDFANQASHLQDETRQLLIVGVHEDVTRWMAEAHSLDERSKSHICAVLLVLLSLIDPTTHPDTLTAIGETFVRVMWNLQDAFTSDTIEPFYGGTSLCCISSKLVLIRPADNNIPADRIFEAGLSFYTQAIMKLSGSKIATPARTLWCQQRTKVNRSAMFADPRVKSMLFDTWMFLRLFTSSGVALSTAAGWELYAHAVMSFMQPCAPYNAWNGEELASPWSSVAPVLWTIWADVEFHPTTQYQLASCALDVLQRLTSPDTWCIDRFPRDLVEAVVAIIPEDSEFRSTPAMDRIREYIASRRGDTPATSTAHGHGHPEEVRPEENGVPGDAEADISDGGGVRDELLAVVDRKGKGREGSVDVVGQSSAPQRRVRFALDAGGGSQRAEDSTLNADGDADRLEDQTAFATDDRPEDAQGIIAVFFNDRAPSLGERNQPASANSTTACTREEPISDANNMAVHKLRDGLNEGGREATRTLPRGIDMDANKTQPTVANDSTATSGNQYVRSSERCSRVVTIDSSDFGELGAGYDVEEGRKPEDGNAESHGRGSVDIVEDFNNRGHFKESSDTFTG